MKIKSINFLNKRKSENIKNENTKQLISESKIDLESDGFGIYKSVSYNNFLKKMNDQKNINKITSRLINNYRNSFLNNSPVQNIIHKIKLCDYDIFCYLLGFLRYKKSSKIKIMDNLIDFKIKVLSEEEIFATHYLLKSLESNLIQNNKFNNIIDDKQSM